MVLPITPVPQYPNVPVAPGVPPLLRAINQVSQIQNTAVLLVADAIDVLTMFSSPSWGIFSQNGTPVIIPDSVVDAGFRKEYRISDFPQEQGSFASYNKVETPFDAPWRLAKGGTDSDRTSFLNAIAQATASLNLYALVMPEVTYRWCNITRYAYQRSQRQGVTLLLVDIWLEEVRITGTTQYSSTAQPAAANPQNVGTVQSQTPTAQQTSNLPSGVESGPGAGSGPPSTGTGAGSDAGGGATPGTTVGQPSEPYFDGNGNQIGIAPSTTAPSGPIVGTYGNGQPVIGGAWQQGFYDSNMNWVHP
jgi:hypothetical protein